MIIQIIINYTIVTCSVDKKTFCLWKKNWTKYQKKDYHLDKSLPLLFEAEYNDYLSFKQNLLIDKLLK